MVGMRRCRWNPAAPASELGRGVDQLGQQAIDAHLRVDRCTGTKGEPPLALNRTATVSAAGARCALGAARRRVA
eukprot:scaffold39942_cov59-Phaeocystis_antarctica.AAC.1